MTQQDSRPSKNKGDDKGLQFELLDVCHLLVEPKNQQIGHVPRETCVRTSLSNFVKDR